MYGVRVSKSPKNIICTVSALVVVLSLHFVTYNVRASGEEKDNGATATISAATAAGEISTNANAAPSFQSQAASLRSQPSLSATAPTSSNSGAAANGASSSSSSTSAAAKSQCQTPSASNAGASSQQVVAIETPDDTVDNLIIDFDAPSYDQLNFVSGWNRYSGDSASTVKQWMRWWQYLRLKTPIVMRWIDGFVLRIYPGNEIFRALFIKGIYDPNSMMVVKNLLPEGGVFIDVGASFGYFSIVATDAVGPSGRVMAIEPSSRDYARLVDNIQINNLGNVVSTYRLAISDKKGTALLSIATEERSALNTLGNEFSFKGIDNIAKEEIETVSLDEFLEFNPVDRVDFIKLDIEGSELKALEDAKKTIEKFKPVLMLGVNENALRASGTDHDKIQITLTNLGYRAYKLVEDQKNGQFTLELIPDLTKESAKVVFCFPEGINPPELPKVQQRSLRDRIEDFFTK